MRPKKKTLSILFSISLFALTLASCQESDVSSSSFSNDTVSSSQSNVEPDEPVNENHAIPLISPLEGSSFSLLDEKAKAYLAASSEAEQIAALKENEYKPIAPQSVTLEWANNNSAYYQLYYGESPDLSDAKIKRISGLIHRYNLTNLKPGTTYYWQIKGTRPEDRSKISSFQTAPETVRLLSISGVYNVRDMGGWSVGDHKVSYGKIIRGGALNNDGNGARITEEGKATMRDELGIKTEVDLRIGDYDDNHQTQNAWDSSYPYIKANLGQYVRILDRENWEILHAEDKTKSSDECSGTSFVSLRSLFNTLADASSYPIYVHCNAGADRTGTFAFLVNGLLGVSYQNLIQDYELTTFSRYGLRARSAIENNAFTASGVQQASGGNFVAFGAMHDAFMRFYSNGGTLQDAITNYLTKEVGISLYTIEQVKANLIEGYVPHVYERLTKRQEILLSGQQKSISLPTDTYDTVEDILYRGESLGKDLTALSFANSPKYAGEGEILVKATKNGVKKEILVPVLLVSKEIGTFADLIASVNYQGDRNNYGYYRLTADVGGDTSKFGTGWKKVLTDNGAYYQTDGSLGFRGTLDGAGHTITGKTEYGGLFASIGAGALIQNVTFNNIHGDNPGGSCVLLATSIVDATLRNVTFRLLSGSLTQIGNAQGWISSFQVANNVFDHVIFDAKDCVVANLFGGYSGWTGLANNRFVACELYANEIQALGYRYADSRLIAPIGQTGLVYRGTEVCLIRNEIQIGNEEANLVLGEAYAPYSIHKLVVMSQEEREILDYDYDEGLLSFPIASHFTNADSGEQKLIASFALNDGSAFELEIPLTVLSSYRKVKLPVLDANIFDVTASSFSLSLGAYQDAVVESIRLGEYDFGKDASHLVMPDGFLNDKANHGEQEIHVFCVKDLQEYELIVPVTFVTMHIADIDTFVRELGTYWTKSIVEGYYVLDQDIGSATTKFQGHSDSIDIWDGWQSKGFHATLDGRGHKIEGITASPDSGYSGSLFGAIGPRAKFKNITFVDHGYDGASNASLLAGKICNASFENVTFSLKGHGSSALGAGIGWLSYIDCGLSSFRHCAFDMSGMEVGNLFGNNCGAAFTSTFEDCTLKARSVTVLSRNGDSAQFQFSVQGVAGLTVTLGA